MNHSLILRSPNAWVPSLSISIHLQGSEILHISLLQKLMSIMGGPSLIHIVSPLQLAIMSKRVVDDLSIAREMVHRLHTEKTRTRLSKKKKKN